MPTAALHGLLSYSTVALYSRVWVFPPKIIDQNPDSQYFYDAFTVLVVHNQAQACFQNDPNCF